MSCDGGCYSACMAICDMLAGGGTHCNGTCLLNCHNECKGTCISECGTSCSSNCSGDCGRWCSSECTTGCSGTCKDTCKNGCNTSCNDTCKDSCNTGCNDTCKDGCNTGCNDTCKDGCNTGCKDGCGGCTSCTSCSGCSGCSGCGGTCSNSCSGECDSGCNKTCKSDCNNACKSSEAASLIAKLGSSIKKGNPILKNDILEIRKAIQNEIKRRKLSSENDINLDEKTLLEDSKKAFEDIKLINSSKDINLLRGDVFKASNYDEAITYVKKIMSENIKNK